MYHLTLLALAFTALAHSLVQSLITRSPGAATAAVCGNTMVAFYKTDNTLYPEALMRASSSGLKNGYDPSKCNLYPSKGFQFADNAA
jgi:hypothetical protein